MAQKDPGKERTKWYRKGFPWWTLYLIMLIIVIIPYFRSNYATPQIVPLNKLENDLIPRNAVEKIVVTDLRAEIYLRPAMAKDSAFRDVFKPSIGKKPNPGPHYWVNIGSVEAFDRKLDELQKNRSNADKIAVEYRTGATRTGWRDVLNWILPMAIVIGIIYFWAGFNRSPGGTNMFDFSRSKPALITHEEINITFNDVAGSDEAKLEVKELVDFLKKPDDFTKLGAKIPKGAILVGPPGTGKTLMAKAVAGEAQVPFFSISGSEFVEMYVGVGASRVRDLFRQAKEKAPCIIFIDEIDAIGRSRGKGAFLSGANDERESTLNQLLTELDGFGTNSGVIVLAATNRADMLDPALLRPGRFDRHIYLELPNLKEREDIFKVHLRPLVLDDTINVEILAGQTPGFSGADIANICNEAALIAARQKKEKVGREDFFNAIDRIVAGIEKKSKIISTEEKKRVAFHEAGHAVISWLLKEVDPLIKVSIIPRGKTLGAAWYLPEEKNLRSKSAFREHMCATLGGRAAEELIFGEPSTGALDDLERVTKEAYMMIMYFGFNEKIGPVSFYNQSGQEYGMQKPYSEETARLIDEEARILINDTYSEAKKILNDNKAALEQVALLLLRKETIYKDDLENILGKRPEDAIPIRPATNSPTKISVAVDHHP